MDPDLIQQLLNALNPVSSAQAQMLGPTVGTHPGAGMVPPQSLETPTPTVGQGGSRAQEFVVPGPRLDLAAQAQAPQSVAAATTPPPPASAASPVPGVPTPTNPMARPPEPYMTEPAATVGSVLEPHPLPQPRPANAPTATDLSSQAVKPGDDILKSLRGVQMPKPPEAQKVSTPHAPQLRPIQSGGLADLMASLNIGPQQAFPGLKLPSTLGQALGGK